MTTLASFRENVANTYLGLGRHASGALLDLSNERWICKSPFHHPISNFAIRFDFSDSAEMEIVDFAKSVTYSRVYVLPGDSPQDLAYRLKKHHLEEKYRLAAMEFVGQVEIPEVSMHLVDTDVELWETAVFMTRVFFWRSERPVREELAKIIVGSSFESQQFYVARDAFGIQAAMTLSIQGGVVGLYNVCVRMEDRGVGIGSDVVRFASARAQDLGLPLILQCDVELVPWYRRLGFQEFGEMLAFGS